MKSHRIENQSLSHELRINVLVALILTHVEALLGEDIIFDFSCPQAAGAGSGYVNQTCTRRHTEFDTTLGSANIHVFNLCSLGEMLDDGGTVEDGVNGCKA